MLSLACLARWVFFSTERTGSETDRYVKGEEEEEDEKEVRQEEEEKEEEEAEGELVSQRTVLSLVAVSLSGEGGHLNR